MVDGCGSMAQSLGDASVGSAGGFRPKTWQYGERAGSTYLAYSAAVLVSTRLATVPAPTSTASVVPCAGLVVVSAVRRPLFISSYVRGPCQQIRWAVDRRSEPASGASRPIPQRDLISMPDAEQ